MREFPSITDQERKLIAEGWYPHVPKAEMDVTLMQFMTNGLTECSAPLASYVLNRVGEWLDGGERFRGDGTFEANWREQGDEKTCTLSRKSDGALWAVDWGRHEYLPDARAITISLIDQDGERIEIATGEITTKRPGSGNRLGLTNFLGFAISPVVGTVDGYVRTGAFDDLCAFSDAVRGSIPDKLLKVNKKNAVTVGHVSRLKSLDRILEADGGLPGRICAARQMMATADVCRIAGDWMQEQYAPLIEGLRDQGAVWGKGMLSYNDMDYYCCLVDFSDGSIGLFSDNIAACADEHAYVARLETDGDIVNSVAVHVFRKGDHDYQAMIDAIGEGSALPDFVYDYERQTPSFPGGRYGWHGMNMFLWQSLSDCVYGLRNGEIDEEDARYWLGSPEDDGASLRS
jgi:hypothetical protein